MGDVELVILEDAEVEKVKVADPWDLLEKMGIMIYFSDGSWHIWNNCLINLSDTLDLRALAERIRALTGAELIGFSRLRKW